MHAIVGLGNPGRAYAWTRHNLGFLVVDRLAQEAGISVNRIECDALIGRGRIAGAAVLLVKPQTFMNRSGKAVACLLSTYGLRPADVVVVVDDLTLPLGTLRWRRRGRAGGHNGLKSIIEEIGTTDFPRLRLGIRPDRPPADTVEFVLSEISPEERPTVEAMIGCAVAAMTVFLRDGIEAAMSRFNGPISRAADTPAEDITCARQ